MKHIFAAALAVFALVQSVGATSLTVEESRAPGGDYADALGAVGNNIGAAPAGTTEVTILGDMRCNAWPTCTGGLNDPFDAFYVDVAVGTKITEVTVSTEADNGLTLLAQLFDTATNTQIFSTSFSGNQSVTLLSSSDSPLMPGNYNFALSLTDAPASGGRVYEYRIGSRIATTPVPLPASLPLLFAGVGGMAFAARRRKNA